MNPYNSLNMNKTLLPLLIVALLAAGCVKRQDRSRNADKYDQWKASLADSITSIQNTIKLTEDSLADAYAAVDSMLANFAYVENQREVEGYTILKTARPNYPLTRSGITARIAKSEAFELIAVLAGGSFTSISVSNGNATSISDTIGYDQGLNYRADGINTVLFTGEKANSIGRLIANSDPNSLTIRFNGGSGRTMKIPASDANVVALTWQLAEARLRVNRLERNLPLLNRKIDLLRSRTE